MTEMSGLDREVTPQGKATGVSQWFGVYGAKEHTLLKSKFRSSKSQTNQQIQKSKTKLFRIFCFLVIWICFEFRVSSL